ncbi:hypothetical protein AAFN85_12010 [Mucilaginibacter sp. CAU 1740]|uniref:hypothetical protein n=1 Tax=Mucilaginibacter sp. CAU 1740 TaxID=3140365 RepID=UPI00325B9A9E
MKYLRYIILLALFIGMVLWLNKHNDEDIAKSEKLLHNGIKFSGEVINTKVSNNHAFGIIYLKLKSTNTTKFIKSAPKAEFPYRINGDKAELYTTIGDGLAPGDSISVISDSVRAIFYQLKSRQKYESFIEVIKDPFNIEFINDNNFIKVPNR